MLATITFYLFSFVLVLSALLVITARNPVHSVLFLILAFFNAAGLFVLLGAEFLALILVIVYVGAVAVLFLFVVMMLDINFASLREKSMKFISLGGVIGFVLLGELMMMFTSWKFAPGSVGNIGASTLAVPKDVTNTEMLGQLIYTHYIYIFQISGLILFVAMIGAIVLTHRSRAGVRKQSVASQTARKPADVLKINKVESGKGV